MVSNKAIAAIAAVCIGLILFFAANPFGVMAWNSWFGLVQKADDATNYETLKQVEDTCRSMIASYEADRFTYEQYKNSEDDEQQSWAEQAKMRANRTASTYNNYMRFITFIRKLCGNEAIALNEAVYLSEKATGDRNRALAYYLKASGILEGNVEECLDFYFRMCSVNVTAVDIAQMSAVLANHGACPGSGEQLIPPESAKAIRALMLTCGMYDGSGEFAMTVGFPAKSGVGGGIAAALVDRMGIGVFGPSLDEKGNSVGGIKVLEHISKNLDFNLF